MEARIYGAKFGVERGSESAGDVGGVADFSESSDLSDDGLDKGTLHVQEL